MTHRLVSVVTPFYNTAPYLAECIESVLDQRDCEFEYVLLDNCSTDGSEEVARRYAERSKRIRLYRNDRLLPQVPNYNRALTFCSKQADYIKIVEADNWLYPECLSQMTALASAHPSIGVVSSYNVTETQVRLTGLPLACTRLSGAEAWSKYADLNVYAFGAPTTVLLRADLVRARAPFFDEQLKIAEDLSAFWDLLQESDFGFVHQVLTFVRAQNESLLSKIRGLDAQELDRVLLTFRHASQFMGPERAAKALHDARRSHYRAMARGMLRSQGRRFFEFHRDGLISGGLDFHRGPLLAALIGEAVRLLFHPTRLLNLARGRPAD
jgi:glycosyltransferase involved in cell wall biosynthesis